ncbi:phage tail tube protein [Anaerosporobacter sp.]|uniref:phage tail tube protein n=1 Tax=Anaerosporobacter sp. TaxID=1872529 RepID=UPI00286F3F4E|nr:phage tail tube protein [Anaerosporobacter sp.]
MGNITMLSKDAIGAALAECYVTIRGKRYNCFNFINFESSFTKTKAKVPILGKTGKGNKATGWEGTFKATIHYNTSIFRSMMKNFKDTGEDVYFEIQVTNEDPSSAAGRQTINFYGCNIDGGILAKFDADGEYLDEEVAGTYDDFEMPEEFTLLDGMLTN